MDIDSSNRNRANAPKSTVFSSDLQPQNINEFELFDDIPPEHIQTTSRYQVVDEIGRGGVGVVYRAQDWDLNRFVAVKVLRNELCENAKLVTRFIDESRIMGSLQHPCIPHVYDCGFCEDGRPFHAMMLIQGQTFYSILRNVSRNRFLLGKHLNIFARICQTVAYVHSSDIAHLDLKPANIMVGEFGEVHLMDWGLARRQSDDSMLEATEETVDRKIQGTLEYMSPEQANGQPLDPRTDVFCLGAILYEILSGQTIYQGEDRFKLYTQAKNSELKPAFEKLDALGVHQPLARLARRCLATNPQDRPFDATILAAELFAYQSSKLERMENDMTRFFELSLDLFCIAGFDGFFRRINSNFSRVLGYSESQLLSHPFMDYVHNDDQESTKNVMSVLSHGQPVVRFRNRYRAKDGTYFHFEWTAKSIPSENVIFAVARNVTADS